jgi:ornithine carbamoyltransferase
MKPKHFLSISDISTNQFHEILGLATDLKQELKSGKGHKPIMAGKTGLLVFRKPSLRTRLSFEVGINQLGGNTVYLGSDEIGLGQREPTKDIARVLGSMGDCIIGRVHEHETLSIFSQESGVPVINGLSDIAHPCQILADMLTIQEKKGSLENITIAYVGDAANNVAASLISAAGLVGINLRIAAPEGYQPDLSQLSLQAQSSVAITTDAGDAVQGADVVYTDTWVSMGHEEEKEKRISAFAGFTVTEELMKQAQPDAIFMHDMPAYRGYEVEEAVIDGPQSVIYHQAENRLHSQKGLLSWLFSYEN